MTLIESYEFIFNKDATENRLRFPDMAEQSYVFSISVSDTIYTVKTFWNTWLNTPYLNIYNQNNEIVISGAILMPRITDYSPNFLANNIFEGYYLFWDKDANKFLFYQDDED